MLGVDDPRFLDPAARDHRGAGIELYIRLLDGERAFHAVILGYRFLIAEGAVLVS